MSNQNGVLTDTFVPRTGPLEPRVEVLEHEMFEVQNDLHTVNDLVAEGSERDAKIVESLKEVLARREQSQSTMQAIGIVAVTGVVVAGMALKFPTEAVVTLAGVIGAATWKAQERAAARASQPLKSEVQ